MGWKTLDDMELAGKRVLLRVDINVPVEDGKVTDTTRIDRIVPTVQDILSEGGKPILLAHFGRPKGAPVPEMGLAQVLPALRDALGTSVKLIDLDAAGASTDDTANVLLLENVRFHPGEEANDPEFAKRLAALGEIARSGNVGGDVQRRRIVGMLHLSEQGILEVVLDAQNRGREIHPHRCVDTPLRLAAGEHPRLVDDDLVQAAKPQGRQRVNKQILHSRVVHFTLA